MLQEGFSGKDGRTSIFDWCSAPSVVRMLKGNLLPDEEEILGIYREMLSVVSGSMAIMKGETYDLQYANYSNPNFDSRNCFVFARKFTSSPLSESFHRGGNTLLNENNNYGTDELVIVAVDFSQSHSSAKINLPQEFFRYWQIPYGKLDPYTQLEVSFNKYGVAILKFYNLSGN